MHLRYALAGSGAKRSKSYTFGSEFVPGSGGGGFGNKCVTFAFLDISACDDPFAAKRGQSVMNVAMNVRVCPRAACVINADGRIFFERAADIFGRCERDLAKRNPQFMRTAVHGRTVRFYIDLPRGWKFYLIA